MVALTEVEKEILDRINYYITMQEEKSLAFLAEECHVAQSTIVKMSKKLGYHGFVELYYQMRKKHQDSQTKGMDNLIVGDLNETIELLAYKMKEYEDCKNIIASYGIQDILSPYLSRKLAMFDIFAPATYDYIMAKSLRKQKGIAFFCNQKGVDDKGWKEMMQVVKKEGFYIVTFSDHDDNWAKKYSDFYIQIAQTKYETADFYCAKMLMFIELWLSAYAKITDFSIGGTQCKN